MGKGQKKREQHVSRRTALKNHNLKYNYNYKDLYFTEHPFEFQPLRTRPVAKLKACVTKRRENLLYANLSGRVYVLNCVYNLWCREEMSCLCWC